jgi:hypothetical protein
LAQVHLFAAVVTQDRLDGLGQAPVIDAAIGAQVGQLPAAGVLGMTDVGEAPRGKLVLGVEQITVAQNLLAVPGSSRLGGAVDAPGAEPPQPAGRAGIG